MGLWSFGDKFQKVLLGRVDMGSDAYLYLPGPSLSEVDFDVRVPGTMAFAVNTAYPKVKPHVRIGMDKPECYDYQLMYEGFIKILRGTYSKRQFHEKYLYEFPSTYFADVVKPQNGIADMFKGNDSFAWFSHTLGVALNVMLWMGAKKIHLVGCNLGGGYYDDRKLSDDQRAYNQRLYTAQVIFLREFKALCDTNNIELVSCTPDSPINHYMPYIPLKRAIEKSRARVGEPHEIKHVLAVTEDQNRKAADNIQWKEPLREKCVLVMCDAEQEWLLDNWYYHYRRFNDYPVVFVDIGMSESGINFCKAHGSYVRMSGIQLKNWFKKPFVLKLTQAKKTLFCDLDAIVDGSLYDAFEIEGFAVAPDVKNIFSTVAHPINSGVIVYDWGNPIIDEWAEETLSHWQSHRSDQDVLDHLFKKDITRLPEIYNWVRLRGENKNAVIRHYTGPVGKKILKDMINEQR